MNIYDWCVMKNMVNGKQCTIKVSHVDKSVVGSVLDKIDKKYDGWVSPLVKIQGKIYEYFNGEHHTRFAAVR